MHHTVEYTQVVEKATELLQKNGFNDEEIRTAIRAWEYAAFSERYDHGFDRLTWLFEMVKQTKIIPNSPFTFTTKGIISQIKGTQSLGYNAAEKAVALVMHSAKQQGIGCATLTDCFPTSCMGQYSESITKENLIGIAISHIPRRVAAYGTTEAIYGTTGHSFGFPSETIPYIYDSSIGALTNGQVMEHFDEHKQFPKDTIYTKEGKATQNPTDVFDSNGIFNGIITLAGGKDAHKISGFAGSMELLTRLALLQSTSTSELSGYSFFMAINPSFFGDIQSYKSLVSQLETSITSARKNEDTKEVFFAGQRSYLRRQVNKKSNKVVISDKTYRLLFE